MRNGRPDRGYLYWRWKPHGCDLSQLDPKMFLDLMRNKSWALIGDSISRNHVQSLLCLLSMVKLDKVTSILSVEINLVSMLLICQYLPQQYYIVFLVFNVLVKQHMVIKQS